MAGRLTGWSWKTVRAFQVHLVSTGISWPALNQIVCALRFFYGVTLGEALIPERIPYARQPLKLPVVLSADEVVQFLEAVSSLKSRAALTTAYAAGLRASEVAGLRIEDIDSARGVIQVRHGKGAKDRNVMLSPQLLGILRTYWRLARPRVYLFPGRDEDHPIDQTVLHAACRSAVKAAGLVQASARTAQRPPRTAALRACAPACSDRCGYEERDRRLARRTGQDTSGQDRQCPTSRAARPGPRIRTDAGTAPSFVVRHHRLSRAGRTFHGKG